MKYIISFLFTCLFTMSLIAQDKENKAAVTSISEEVKHDVYPAAGNVITSERVNSFIDLFNSQNVGNLHVHAMPNTESKKDYPLYGNPISSGYYPMFDMDWQSKLYDVGQKAYAVYSIRGDDEEFYIIRFNTEDHERLELFELRKSRLYHKATLAYARTNGEQYWQMDSWIQDVDGDTRLDLIRKFKRGTASTIGSEEPTIEVMQQTDDGKYVIINDEDWIPASERYPMKAFATKDF